MRRVAMLLVLLVAGLARAEAPTLGVQILGSGGPRPSAQASSGTLVLVDGVARILVDAGPGTLLRAGERQVDLSELDTVLLTHLHTDHAAELPSFATVRSLDGRGTTRLRVIGPDGNKEFPSTRAFVSALLGPQGAFRYVRHFGAELAIEATDVPAGPQAVPRRFTLADGLVVTARGHHHGDAPAVGFRIEHAGRSVVLTGDVDPSGLPAVEQLVAGADLLVISCSVLDPPDSPPGLYERHSPPSAIGAMAARARVKALVCTHLPPAVTAQADAVRRSLATSFSGPVTLATDGLVIPATGASSAR
ncbi:MAG TPA: MBL fold metallo-hydrolase [Myxococcaceae bacterium]|nr:MBL fold metallo-hydrolase [Myxococcaceae bacterium]